MADSIKPPSLIKLGFYLGLSNVALIGIGVTDVLMAGWLGAYMLAASTLATILYQVVVLVGVGFVSGVGSLLSKYLGAGDRQALRYVVTAAILLLVLLFAPSFLCLYFGAEILRLFGQSELLITIAEPYLLYLAATLPLSFAYGLLWIIASVQGQGKFLLWISIALLFLNAAGNYVLMFGGYGIEAMGITGLGASTLISTGATLIILFMWLKAKGVFTSFRPTVFAHRIPAKYFRETVAYGFPVALLQSTTLAFFAVITFIVGFMGAIPLSVHAITLQLAEIGTGIGFGFSEAASIVVAHHFGSKNSSEMITAVRQSLIFGGGAIIAYGILLVVVGDTFVPLFLEASMPNAAIVEVSVVSLLVFAGFCLAVDSGRIMLVGILRGYGDTSTPINLTMFCLWIIAIPAAGILGLYLDYNVTGVWVGMTIGLGAASVILSVRLMSIIRQRKMVAS